MTTMLATSTMTQRYRASACYGKKAYETWSDAQVVIRRYGKRKNKRMFDHGIYRCRFCQHWHIGGRD